MKKVELIVLVLFVFIGIHFVAFAKINVDVLGLEDYLYGPTKEQNMRKAIVILEKMIEEEPEELSNHVALAYIYNRMGSYERVVQLLELVIKRGSVEDIESDILYGNLAETYINLGRLEEAKSAIDKSLELNPKSIASRKQLLKWYILKKQYNKVALELKVLSELDEKRNFYHYVYLYCSKKINDKEVVDIFREAVSVSPDSHLAQRALATAIRGTTINDWNEIFPIAIKEYKKALELDPRYVPTYISIADTYMLKAIQSKDKIYFKDAEDWFSKARTLEPDNLEITYAEGNMYIYMEEYDKAIKKLKSILEKYSNDFETVELLAIAYNNKAYGMYKKGENLDEGLILVNKAIMLRRNDGITLGTKAEILYKMGKYDEAYRYIKKGLKLKPGNKEMEQDLANIEEALRQNTD